MTRTLHELTHVDAPAWPGLESMFAGSPTPVVVVPAEEPSTADQILETFQVSVASPLGAIVWNAGAVVIDDGWLTLVGSGTTTIPAAEQRTFRGGESGPAFVAVLCAYDAVGGLFAVHGWGFPEADPGEILYWAPDSLDWQGLGMPHSTFVEFVLSPGLDTFYTDLRWQGWRNEVSALKPGEGMLLYPPPSTVEGQDIAAVSKTAVPITELHAFAGDASEAYVTPDPESGLEPSRGLRGFLRRRRD